MTHLKPPECEMKVIATREELDALGQSPVLFDALIEEDEKACVYVKSIDLDDPTCHVRRSW